jgi:hypothetical protein
MSRHTPIFDGQSRGRHRGPSKLHLWKVLWYQLRGRHDDGTAHVLVRDEDWDGRHPCDSDYCHHYQVKCTVCGSTAIHGDTIPEVR